MILFILAGGFSLADLSVAQRAFGHFPVFTVIYTRWGFRDLYVLQRMLYWVIGWFQGVSSIIFLGTH